MLLFYFLMSLLHFLNVSYPYLTTIKFLSFCHLDPGLHQYYVFIDIDDFRTTKKERERNEKE